MFECHHIIFKSQGGLDFPLNFKYLSAKDHRGNNGPHLNRQVDLQYKEQLEYDLRALLVEPGYSIEEVILILGLDSKQAHRAFKTIVMGCNGMDKEDIIFRLMGNRFYI